MGVQCRMLATLPLLLLLVLVLPPTNPLPQDIAYWGTRDMAPDQAFRQSLFGGSPHFDAFMRTRRGEAQRESAGNRRVEGFQRMYRGDKPAYVNNSAQAVMRGLG